MKKTLTILLLVLAITTSLIAGTMAYYTVTLDNLVQGEVVAKEFIFVEKEGRQTLSFSNKIAPGETVEWPFTVQNHKDGLVTETDMYYRLTFVVGATEGKQAIAPLTVTVNGEAVSLDNDGTGTLTTDGEFKLKPTDNQQSEDYKIVLTWPHGDNDSAYAGNNFGTTVTVNAVAQQVPFDEVEPETPEEPGTEEPGTEEPSTEEPGTEEPGTEKPDDNETDIVIQYSENTSRQFLNIEIINNSDVDITEWTLYFHFDGASLNSVQNLDYNIFKNLGDNYFSLKQGGPHQRGYTIKPGESLNFDIGYYSEQIPLNLTLSDVTLDGSPVELIKVQ